MKIGDIVPMDKYSEYAVWCNQNGAVIKDKGDHYEVVLEFNGVEYPSFEDAAYLKAKAEAQAEAERQAMVPTSEERIEAQVMYTALMTDTLLEEE